MRIALVTQDDPLYIPAALDAMCRARAGDMVAIIVLRAFNEGLGATAKRLYQFYGLRDFTRLTKRFAWAKAADRLNRLASVTRPYSAADVARRHQVPLYRPESINSRGFVATLREAIQPDLIVSIAASQIFRRRVLDVPKHGCINLHSAPLPRYQGMMPNFWVMMHGEPEGAVTVHYMAEAIDAGDIIVQKAVPILARDSLHDLMVRSKEVGVQALLEAIERIERGEVGGQPMAQGEATYFSFPTRADALRLRSMGRSLL